MKIRDSIAMLFRRGQVVSFDYGLPFTNWGLCSHEFAQVIWYNICDILTDLVEDVKMKNEGTEEPLSKNGMKFAAFVALVYNNGKQVLQRVYDEGYVVLAYDGTKFRQLKSTEYTVKTEKGVTVVEPNNKELDVYVMKSSSFEMYGRSDKSMCKGWINFLDDVMNGSATVSKRLGAVVVASPKNLNNAPTAVVLTDEQKEKIEKDMQKSYGALSRQSNVMLLPREMSWQTINLAGLDLKMQEKTKMAILAIVDRIKVPANQVAIIDAQSSKTLANGSEMREGDKLKYKSFRRLFERTFADMARYYGIQMSYVIDGEPIGADSQVIVNQ